MKRLYVLRHAKSSRSEPGLEDEARPLNGRGRRAGALLAGYCREQGVRPSLVLCSTAERARQTLELILPSLGDRVRVIHDARLYGTSTEGILATLRAVGDAERVVMVVGHNPDLHGLVVLLAGRGESDALARARAAFPTGALATLDVSCRTWRALGPGSCSLAAFVVPKELG
ncbi:MAG: histidine phosphatase family protein [Alphaproteobacteria bacterium]